MATVSKRRHKELQTETENARLKRGKAGRYFSLRGEFLVAAKRNMGNASACHMGMMLGVDVSGKTL